MKSSQINFYLTSDDAEVINSFIRSNDLLIISQPMRSNKLEFVDSVIDKMRDGKEIQSIKFLVRKEDQELVAIKYIPTQNYYLIDSSNAPVIEFWFPLQKDKNIIRRGRLYYSKDYLDKTSKTEILKNPEFLNSADTLFKWFRKTFKTPKLEGYEDFIISPEALRFHRNGGTLLVNPEVSESVLKKEKAYHSLAS